MKTTVITLQGKDFVVTEPAYRVAIMHLKELQKATRFHSAAYRDNVEALRDVLIEQGDKSISKTKMILAIELVGIPDTGTLSDTFRARFPRLYRLVRNVYQPVGRFLAIMCRYWWQSLIVIFATVAIFLSVMFGFTALMTLHTNSQSWWSVATTSIGQVRMYTEAVATLPENWVLGWQGSLLSALTFLVIAVLLLRLRRPKRLPFVLGLFACVVLLFCLTIAERQLTPDYATGANVPSATHPLEARMAYLRQCGDEIRYVSGDRTDGMLFRHLRDEGFTLAVTIPTRESDGTVDTAVLCKEYDVLRRDHPASHIVLQYFAKNDDGTIRPYDYTDIGEDRSAYGLFVKS